MPHTDKQIESDNTLFADGLCPECRKPLSKLSGKAHAAAHWPARIDPGTGDHSDAIRRRDLVASYDGPVDEPEPER
jgi:hypothetical protein